MIGIAVIGCGRIGRMHAENVARNPRARLAMVYDVHGPAAQDTAVALGAINASGAEEIFASPEVDGVLIASSTDTHVDMIVAAARAGKVALCEKPIDLDITRVEKCRKEIEGTDARILLGFNRRFDPTHAALRAGIAAGRIGEPELVIISSRDPGLPPLDYLKRSGGLFRDMTIHDFDMARFLLNEEPIEVFATASNRVDSLVREIGDFDTAMVVMKTAKGALIHINNSRRAVYGYDQRVEVFGAEGMLRSDNPRETALVYDCAEATDSRTPLHEFFIERYPESYLREIDHFVDVIEEKAEPSVTFEDGRKALILADAAVKSLQSGRAVSVRNDV